jgi:peroxin-16
MNIYRQASASTYEALTLPAKWLGQYDEFIIKNSSAVSQIESALRSLTYIIPGTSLPGMTTR